MRILKNITDKLEEYLLIIILLVICSTMVVQVFYRYILNDPLMWSEEFARFLLVWLTLLGMGYGVRKGIHIEMPFFFEKFSYNMQKVLQIGINILVLVFFIYLMPYVLEYTETQQMITSTSLGIPMSYLYLSLITGIVIVVIRLVEQIVHIIISMVKKTELRGGENR
ncbi:TRAP transporter small permease [Oceanobacillus locisalsi]|uniref:TRAP transporter small permease n=1 Tax=Oceanobacillus locisalsi TaxID=546107 RepID=A0ABW3NDZ9_9BACI